MVALTRVLVFGALCLIATTIPAAGQQRGSVSGRVLDAGGLVLPGALPECRQRPLECQPGDILEYMNEKDYKKLMGS